MGRSLPIWSLLCPFSSGGWLSHFRLYQDAGCQAICLVFCSHPRAAHWPGASLPQGASIPVLLSPTLQLISELFWTEGCSFHGLKSWTLPCASQGVPLAFSSICLPPLSTLQISKHKGRGRNICRAWTGKDRRNCVGSSLQADRERGF